jgi:trehalose-6-phosphatase
VGDDRTDADAFSALTRMPSIATLAVGVRSAEVPDDVFVQTDLMVDGVPGVTQLLRALLALCANP